MRRDVEPMSIFMLRMQFITCKLLTRQENSRIDSKPEDLHQDMSLHGPSADYLLDYSKFVLRDLEFGT